MGINELCLFRKTEKGQESKKGPRGQPRSQSQGVKSAFDFFYFSPPRLKANLTLLIVKKNR